MDISFTLAGTPVFSGWSAAGGIFERDIRALGAATRRQTQDECARDGKLGGCTYSRVSAHGCTGWWMGTRNDAAAA